MRFFSHKTWHSIPGLGRIISGIFLSQIGNRCPHFGFIIGNKQHTLDERAFIVFGQEKIFFIANGKKYLIMAFLKRIS